MGKQDIKKIRKALIEKALGYERHEVVEEYAVDADGAEVLARRKVQTKYFPPDLSAMKTFLEINGEEAKPILSDEELKREKQRLLLQLQQIQSEENKQ